MRLVLAGIIWVVIIGAVSLYMGGRRPVADLSDASQTQASRAAVGVFALDVTPSFPAEPDPFALDVASAPSLVVRLGGREILRRTGRLEAGVPIRLEPVPGLVVGHNEFYVEAGPPLGRGGQAHALRLRVFRDGLPISEHTVWTDSGAVLAAAVPVEIRPASEPEDEHEH